MHIKPHVKPTEAHAAIAKASENRRCVYASGLTRNLARTPSSSLP
jgi:hypothetical protein